MSNGFRLLDAGYLVVYARDRLGLSQADLAQKIAPVLKTDTSKALAKIKNYEAGRVRVPRPFLESLGLVAGFSKEWWIGVKKPVDDFVSGDLYIRASTIPDVFVWRAPSERTHSLRSSYVLNKSQWRAKTRLPGVFADDLPEEKDGQFPLLIADIVEEGDETSAYVRLNDVYPVRTDLEPQVGRMVAATGKKGQKYRRLMVMREGRIVLRIPDLPDLDVPLSDVASIEGLIVGRVRGNPEDEEQPFNVVHLRKGLRAEDL